MNNEEVIKYLNENIVNTLVEKGFKHNPDIDINNHEHRKFFAFKLENYKIESLEHAISNVNRILNNYIQDNEKLKDKQIEFNIWKLEYLRDKDSFSIFFRAQLLIKTKSISNYERIKSMTIDEMAELFDDWGFLCNIAKNKDGIKQWLIQENKDD